MLIQECVVGGIRIRYAENSLGSSRGTAVPPRVRGFFVSDSIENHGLKDHPYQPSNLRSCSYNWLWREKVAVFWISRTIGCRGSALLTGKVWGLARDL
eukprot:COSAG02_NODE_4_length_69935_cov_46.806590_50_plen_98_part_00